jgi:hypothetical protein
LPQCRASHGCMSRAATPREYEVMRMPKQAKAVERKVDATVYVNGRIAASDCGCSGTCVGACVFGHCLGFCA